MSKEANQEKIKEPPKENKNEIKSELKNEKTLLNEGNEEKIENSISDNKENKTFSKEEEETEFDKFMEGLENEGTEEEKNEFDALMEDWDDDDEEGLELDDIEETDENPLDEYQGGNDTDEEPTTEAPQTEKVENVTERISSEKNSKNLERLGAKFLDKADFFKASLCSKISGEHLAEYVADDEMKQILIECIKEYLATKEVTEFSPLGALMAALAMWTLPPLGVALLDKYQLQKEEKAATKQRTSKNLNQAPTETESTEDEKGEAQTDYTHLKEFQEQRKRFETNAGGKYNSTRKGEYLSVSLANEKPSPEVQTLIDEGKKDREIRKILGYG
jgi:hypothetical protein